MSLALTRALEALVLPPGGPLLIAALGLACLRRRPRLGAGLLVASWLTLFLLSVPLVAQRLAEGLENVPATTADAARAAQAQAIVVLGGGRYAEAPEYHGDTLSRWALERVRYGAHLTRATGLPVLVSGGAPFGGRPEAALMAAVLDEFGVPVRWREGGSRTTWENASYSAALLGPEDVQRVLLVTSAWHMPRAKATFERAGLEVVPAPTGYTRALSAAGGVANFLPATDALDTSRRVLREHLGAAVYRLRRAAPAADAPSNSTGNPDV